MRILPLAVLAACGGGAGPRDTLVTLRTACGAGTYWDGRACAHDGDAPEQLTAAKQALDKLDVDSAKAALDRAEKQGPLDRDHEIELWEQRGIAAAYVDDDAGAQHAFDMLLALDPGHFLSYTLSPKATFVFEKVRERKDRTPPEIDVSWDHGRKVGDPVPVDVEVLSDPKQFLKRATLFVRTRGEHAWRAADLALGPGEKKLVLPPVEAKGPQSLEVYLRAYDDRGDEVLTWADPARPREIPLRYEPPKRWYEKWWVWTAIGVGAVAIASTTAYELTLAPPDKISGTAMITTK